MKSPVVTVNAPILAMALLALVRTSPFPAEPVRVPALTVLVVVWLIAFCVFSFRAPDAETAPSRERFPVVVKARSPLVTL